MIIGAGYTGYCVDGSVFSILSYKQMKTKILLIDRMRSPVAVNFVDISHHFYYNTSKQLTKLQINT